MKTNISQCSTHDRSYFDDAEWYSEDAHVNGEVLPPEYVDSMDNQKLATECWNLHRSLLEENSKSTFIKDKLLNYKKGVLKLELDLNDCNQKRYDLVKELAAASKQIEKGESKCTELSGKITQLSSFQVTYRRTISKLNSKIGSLELERNEELTKNEVEREGLLRALKELQLTSAVEAKKSKEVHKQLDLELLKGQKESLQYQSRIAELERKVDTLTLQLQTQTENHEEYVKIVHRDLEEAYDKLHEKYETVWSERDELRFLLNQRDNEIKRLKAIILVEGLQQKDSFDAADEDSNRNVEAFYS